MWSRTEGDGRDVVLVHGWTMDYRDEYRAYEPIFKSRVGWKRHYPDLPGMGRTPADSGITDMDGMLEALLGFIRATVGERRFVLSGTSAGGYLARGVLARMGDQVDGVALRVPLIVPDDDRRDRDPIHPLLVDPAVMDAIPADERAELGDVLVQTPAYAAALRANQREVVSPAMAVADGGFLAPIRDDPKRYAFSFDVDAEMPRFERPALIVTGRHDSHVGFRDAWRLMDSFPRATFAVLDRGEHGLPIDQQGLYAALVSDWLDRIEQEVPAG